MTSGKRGGLKSLMKWRKHMPNGTMMKTLQSIIDSDKTIPEYIRYMVAAQLEIFNRLEILNVDVNSLKTGREADKVIDQRNVTWPWIKDNVIVPLIRTAIVLAAGYVFLKLFGVTP